MGFHFKSADRPTFWTYTKQHPLYVVLVLNRGRSGSPSRGTSIGGLLSSEPSHGVERSHERRRGLCGIRRRRGGRDTIGRRRGTSRSRRCFARRGSGRRLSNDCLERNNVGILLSIAFVATGRERQSRTRRRIVRNRIHFCLRQQSKHKVGKGMKKSRAVTQSTK